jgi:hypothetical protein
MMDLIELQKAQREMRDAHAVALLMVSQANKEHPGGFLLLGTAIYRATPNEAAQDLARRAQLYLSGDGDMPVGQEPNACEACSLENHEDGCTVDICPINRGMVWREILPF